jgi:hypothetical protein
MSSQDQALYNQDEGGVLQRLGAYQTGLTRTAEGKLEAQRAVDQMKTAEEETKEARAEEGMGIGNGSAGLFASVVGLAKKRAMGIAKSKAQGILKDLTDKMKANKQELQDRLKQNQQPDADEDPNATDANPAPNSADNPTGGGEADVEPPQPTQAPDIPARTITETTTRDIPARAGQPEIRAPDIPARTTTEQVETSPARAGAVETEQVGEIPAIDPQPAQPIFATTQETTQVPKPHPARSQPDEIDNIADVENESDLTPIQNRIQARFNNLDGEAQARSDATMRGDAEYTENPTSLEDQATNTMLRDEAVRQEEQNPDTTFRDPNLQLNDGEEGTARLTNQGDIFADRLDTQRNPASFDNPDEFETQTTETTQQVAEVPAVEGQDAIPIFQTTQAPPIPAKTATITRETAPAREGAIEQEGTPDIPAGQITETTTRQIPARAGADLDVDVPPPPAGGQAGQLAGRGVAGDFDTGQNIGNVINQQRNPAVAQQAEAPRGGQVGGQVDELQAQVAQQGEDLQSTMRGTISKTLGMSDEDAGALVSKIATGGTEDIISAGSDILGSLSGWGSGALAVLGTTAEVLGPLAMVGGIGLGIYDEVKQEEQEEKQAQKVQTYQDDLQKLSNTTALQTGTIAMPTLDTSQFRTGGMMNF